MNVDMRIQSVFSCKFGHFLQFTSLQVSTWLVVLLSIDRTFSVINKHWKTIYFKDHRAWYVSFGIVGIFATFNTYILVTFGVEVPFNSTMSGSSENFTYIVTCYEIEGYPLTKLITYYGPVKFI
jgi:hypothetical protein